MKNRRGGGGFTLAELLIVMAIIVVLAAVAIPTFGKQLETAREANDAEVIRAVVTDAFTEAYMDFMKDGTMSAEQAYPKKTSEEGKDGTEVSLKQTVTGFNYVTPTFTVGSGTVTADNANAPTIPTAGGAVGTATITVYFAVDGDSIKLNDIQVADSVNTTAVSLKTT